MENQRPHCQAEHAAENVPNQPASVSASMWIDALIPSIQIISIFGGSITFTLILGANAPPSKRFSDQTVRDLLCAAWLSFALALAMGTIAKLAFAAQEEQLRTRSDLILVQTTSCHIIRPALVFCLGGCTLASFLVCSVVILAYSDIGWVAIVINVLGDVICLVGWITYTFSPERLDGLLALRRIPARFTQIHREKDASQVP
jgi:hypothetical protein